MLQKPNTRALSLAATLGFSLLLASCGNNPTPSGKHSSLEITLEGSVAPIRANGPLTAEQTARLTEASSGSATFADGSEIHWENRDGTTFFTDDAGAGPIELLPRQLDLYQAYLKNQPPSPTGRLQAQGAGLTAHSTCNFWFLWCWSSSTHDARWTNATIPYGYAPGTPANLRSEFEQAVQHWNTSLRAHRDQHKPTGRYPRWVLNTQHPERVEVRFTDTGGEGSSAFGGESEFIGFGRNPGPQYVKINANADFDRPLGLYLHEMGHVAGLIHEHQRCDRDEAVTIDAQSAYQDRLNAFTKLCQSDYRGYTPYDYESVMHYPKKAFSRNGRDVIVAKEGARALGSVEKMGFQLELSEGDRRALVEMYSH